EKDHKRILGVGRLSIEPDGKTGELAFIIGDQWQGQGLGTKVVDFVLEIAKEMHIEVVYAIMLPDNRRALNLTKKMGFKHEYMADGTVKGTLDLREEMLREKCFEARNSETQTEAGYENKMISKKETPEKSMLEEDAQPMEENSL
ncbi:GNAT family N-acetyltransferase, partial [Candidatus Bathyarchaeota archaeon]